MKHPVTRALLAYEKWLIVTNKSKSRRSIIDFTIFTGDPYDERRPSYINSDNPEVMRKVDMILGPNGHTILKMMLFQNEEAR